MTPSNDEKFNNYYDTHCKHLRLKGYQPKTIEAYSRAIPVFVNEVVRFFSRNLR